MLLFSSRFRRTLTISIALNAQIKITVDIKGKYCAGSERIKSTSCILRLLHCMKQSIIHKHHTKRKRGHNSRGARAEAHDDSVTMQTRNKAMHTVKVK